MPTHIPVVIGGQMRYEVTGDPLYKVTKYRIQIQIVPKNNNNQV